MEEVDVAAVCKALGDPNRLAIVRMLADEGQLCACKLLERLEISQPTLSHHMRVLADCGLVRVEKDGRWSHYSLDCKTLGAFREFIAGLVCTGKGEGGCCR